MGYEAFGVRKKSLSDTLLGGYDAGREEARQRNKDAQDVDAIAYERHRQAVNDLMNARNIASGFAAKGMFNEARDTMNAYKAKRERMQRPGGEAEPKVPADGPTAGGSAVPDQVDAGRSITPGASLEPPPQPGAGGSEAGVSDWQRTNGRGVPGRSGFTQDNGGDGEGVTYTRTDQNGVQWSRRGTAGEHGEHDPPPGYDQNLADAARYASNTVPASGAEPPVNPVVAARQGQQAQRSSTVQRAMAGRKPQYRDVITYQNLDGSRGTIDPSEAEDFQRDKSGRERDEKTRVITQLIAQTDDPNMKAHLQQYLPIAGIGDQDAAKFVEGRLDNDVKTNLAGKAAELADKRRGEDRTNHVTDLQFQAREAEKRARIAANAAAGRQENRPTTGEERKAEGAASRILGLIDQTGQRPPLSAEGARTIYEDAARSAALEKAPTINALGVSTGLVTPLEDKLSSEDRAQYGDLNEIASVLLRKESGAAISVPEKADVIRRFIRVDGDSEADVARKRRNLLEATRAIGRESRYGDQFDSEINKRLGGAPSSVAVGKRAETAPGAPAQPHKGQRAADLSRVEQALKSPSLTPAQRGDLEKLRDGIRSTFSGR